MFKNCLVLMFVLVKKEIDKLNSLSVQNDHEAPLLSTIHCCFENVMSLINCLTCSLWNIFYIRLESGIALLTENVIYQ